MKDKILWEEKNLIEQSRKLENKQTSEQNVGINETKKEFVKKECNDIGIKKGNREKINWIGKNIRDILITNQFIGKNNRTYVSYKCNNCKLEHSSLLTDIKSGKIKGKCYRLPIGEASFNSLYATYRNNAKLRKNEFTISKENAKLLFQGNCFYCNSAPLKIYKSKKCNGEFLYNGIDRKDNTKGYTTENCVSCCSFCNYTKNNTQFNDFLNWIRKVNENTKNVII